MIAPKPAARPRRVSLWRHLALFRADLLSAQPAHLFRAKLAEFRTPLFRSYLVNQPDLVRRVLVDEAAAFPKSGRVSEGLRPLLGNSVFLTNGATWARQRRIIDLAFVGGRLQSAFPAMRAAAEEAVDRLETGMVSLEPWASRATADIIFRTLFSVPIEDALAARVYVAFQTYQRAQPLVNLGAFLPLPRWIPRFHPRAARHAAREIRAAIGALVAQRADEIARGEAPDDLATKIMAARDPETGERFTVAEMVDQVAIFFLAGHETSAAALSWALWLLAAHPEVQDRGAQEALALLPEPGPTDIARATALREVFAETLRLYPPVPMMVREAASNCRFRDRDIAPGAQLVISPWHLHRHEAHWPAPDAFRPGRACRREVYLPFSAGPRVCPGAGFATVEAVLLLASVLRRWRLETTKEVPVPVAHLTLRSRDGIRVTLTPRHQGTRKSLETRFRNHV